MMAFSKKLLCFTIAASIFATTTLPVNAQQVNNSHNYFEYLYRKIYPSYQGELRKYVDSDNPVDRLGIENRLQQLQSRITVLKSERIESWRNLYNYGVGPVTAIGVGAFAGFATGGLALPLVLSTAGTIVLDAGAEAILTGKQSQFEISVIQEFLQMEKDGFLDEFSKLSVDEQVQHLIHPDGLVGKVLKDQPKLKNQLYDYILKNSKRIRDNVQSMNSGQKELTTKQLEKVSKALELMENLQKSAGQNNSGFKDPRILDDDTRRISFEQSDTRWWIQTGQKAQLISTTLSEFKKIGLQTGMSDNQIEFLDRASNFASFFVYMGAMAGAKSALAAGGAATGAAAAAGPYAPAVYAVLALTSLVGAFGKRKKKKRNEALRRMFELQVKALRKLETIERKIDYNHALEMAALYKINSDVIINNALIDASLGNEFQLCNNIVNFSKSKNYEDISKYYNKYGLHCHVGLSKIVNSSNSVHPIFWMSPSRLNFGDNSVFPITGNAQSSLLLDDGSAIDSFFKKYHHPLWLTVNQHLNHTATGVARTPSMSIRNLDCKIYDGYVETKQVTKKDRLLFPYSGQAGLLVDPFFLARTSNTTRETIVLDDAVRSFSSQAGKSPVLSFEDADAQNLLRVNSDLVDLALLQQSLLLGDSALPVYSAIMQNWFEAFTEVGDQHVLKSHRCAKISPGDLLSDAFRGQIAKLANSQNEEEKERFGEIKKLMRAVVISSLRQNPILRENFIRYFVLSSGNRRNYGDADLTYSILHDATCRTGQIGFIEGLLGERLSIEFSDGMSKFGNSEYDGTLENAKTCLVAKFHGEGQDFVKIKLPRPYELKESKLTVTGIGTVLMTEKSRVVELSAILNSN